MEQREKNLKLSSKLSFTETGLVNQRVFDSKNISIKYSKNLFLKNNLFLNSNDAIL